MRFYSIRVSQSAWEPCAAEPRNIPRASPHWGCGVSHGRPLTGTHQLSASWGPGHNFRRVGVIESGGDCVSLVFLVASFAAVSLALVVVLGGQSSVGRWRWAELGSHPRGPGVGFQDEGHREHLAPRGPCRAGDKDSQFLSGGARWI